MNSIRILIIYFTGFALAGKTGVKDTDNHQATAVNEHFPTTQFPNDVMAAIMQKSNLREKCLFRHCSHNFRDLAGRKDFFKYAAQISREHSEFMRELYSGSLSALDMENWNNFKTTPGVLSDLMGLPDETFKELVKYIHKVSRIYISCLWPHERFGISFLKRVFDLRDKEQPLIQIADLRIDISPPDFVNLQTVERVVDQLRNFDVYKLEIALFGTDQQWRLDIYGLMTKTFRNNAMIKNLVLMSYDMPVDEDQYYTKLITKWLYSLLNLKSLTLDRQSTDLYIAVVEAINGNRLNRLKQLTFINKKRGSPHLSVPEFESLLSHLDSLTFMPGNGKELVQVLANGDARTKKKNVIFNYCPEFSGNLRAIETHDEVMYLKGMVKAGLLQNEFAIIVDDNNYRWMTSVSPKRIQYVDFLFRTTNLFAEAVEVLNAEPDLFRDLELIDMTGWYLFLDPNVLKFLKTYRQKFGKPIETVRIDCAYKLYKYPNKENYKVEPEEGLKELFKYTKRFVMDYSASSEFLSLVCDIFLSESLSGDLMTTHLEFRQVTANDLKYLPKCREWLARDNVDASVTFGTYGVTLKK